MAAKLSIVTADFYPRPPHGGRLYAEPMETIYHCISTHALLLAAHTKPLFIFSTPPPPGGAPDAGGRRFPPRGMISTHALRMEGDNGVSRLTSIPLNFYPRPPHGGRLIHSNPSDSLD